MFIDGQQVVADWRVLTLDEDGATARLRAAQQRMEALASSRDYLGRAADEIMPLSLPVLEGLLGKPIEGCCGMGDTTEAGPRGMLL